MKIKIVGNAQMIENQITKNKTPSYEAIGIYETTKTIIIKNS